MFGTLRLHEPLTGAAYNHIETSAIDNDTSEAVRVRRRNRQITSCLECRRRKQKCDRQAPCGLCTRTKRNCIYMAPATDARSQREFAAMKDKKSAVEDSFGHDSLKAVAATTVVEVTPEDDWHSKDDLESSPLATSDNVYDDNVDDQLLDLGVQLGKLRIAERIGGFVRAKFAEELDGALKDEAVKGITVHTTTQIATARPARGYIGPSPDYVAPNATSLFFNITSSRTAALDCLPSKSIADLLIVQYALAVHPIARAVHLPTFNKQYQMFWVSIASGIEPTASLQAVIFAAMFSALISMDESDVMASCGAAKSTLLETLQDGTVRALSKANFLATTRLDTMQAFVMYLLPMVRSEVSRAHSTLVGAAIRLAQAMGLHRDGSHYSMSAVEKQVRRVVWHQLCFLDMRTCEATGPSPQIRRDENDTRLPTNVDDGDLEHSDEQEKPYFTDMTLFKIRAEITELRRGIWFSMLQIDQRKKSLTAVLVEVQQEYSRMQTKYGSMIDDSIPVQQLARCVLELGLSGLFVQVLHRYQFNTASEMPDRLRQLLMRHALIQQENVMAIETKLELMPWAWYRGAINQYHASIILVREIFVDPERKDADRIWKCLDYIFELPAELSTAQKAHLVMSDLRDLMVRFYDKRKVKLATHIEAQVTTMSRKMSPPQQTGAVANATFTWQNSTVQDLEQAAAMKGSRIAQAKPQTDLPEDAAPLQGNFIEWDAMEDIDWAEWDRYFPLPQDMLDSNEATTI